jgi:hypothetical protein
MSVRIVTSTPLTCSWAAYSGVISWRPVRVCGRVTGIETFSSVAIPKCKSLTRAPSDSEEVVSD